MFEIEDEQKTNVVHDYTVYKHTDGNFYLLFENEDIVYVHIEGAIMQLS